MKKELFYYLLRFFGLFIIFLLFLDLIFVEFVVLIFDKSYQRNIFFNTSASLIYDT